MTVKPRSWPVRRTALGMMFAGGPSSPGPWKIIVVILELFRNPIQNHPSASQPLALDTKVVIYYKLRPSHINMRKSYLRLTNDLDIISANLNLHNFDKK
ncbi:hypothetical protein BYT27DRAFT_7205922 [Phlegmacium glaucopus]|nr:hypothetical protein BYT27DRAFT_7205922 [Phlegmacium glaucopus]